MAEKEYIERDAALAFQNEVEPLLCQNVVTHDIISATKDADMVKYLQSIPAADARPVVTCGKCKYGKYTGTEWFCDKHSGHADKFGEDASYHEYHSKHWFCADGEARNNES